MLYLALEPYKTAWQALLTWLIAQKRGEQQVIQKTKKLYPRIQHYKIWLAPPYCAAPSQSPGRSFCASYTGRSSDWSVKRDFPLLGMRLPMIMKNHSANTATALCEIFTRFPFHLPFGRHLCTLIYTCQVNYDILESICQQSCKKLNKHCDYTIREAFSIRIYWPTIYFQGSWWVHIKYHNTVTSRTKVASVKTKGIFSQEPALHSWQRYPWQLWTLYE